MTTVRTELPDELLADYEPPEDLLGDRGFLQSDEQGEQRRFFGAGREHPAESQTLGQEVHGHRGKLRGLPAPSRLAAVDNHEGDAARSISATTAPGRGKRSTPSGTKTRATAPTRTPPPRAIAKWRNSSSSHRGRMRSIRARPAPSGMQAPASVVQRSILSNGSPAG